MRVKASGKQHGKQGGRDNRRSCLLYTSYQNMPLSDTDYISYVLVVDKEFEKTEAFQDFIHSYNRAVSRLSNSGYLARVMGVKEEWLENKNIKFLTLEETGVD